MSVGIWCIHGENAKHSGTAANASGPAGLHSWWSDLGASGSASCRAEHAGYPSARHARTQQSNIYRWVGGHTVGKRYMDGGHATHSKQRALHNILSRTFFRWPGRHERYGGSPSHREVLTPVEEHTTAKRPHGMHERSNATLPATLPVPVSYTGMTGADAYGGHATSRPQCRWFYATAGYHGLV